MSLGGIENSFIVKKAKNFTIDERDETGYKWTDKHQARSPLKLVSGHSMPTLQLALNNCDIFKVNQNKTTIGLTFNLPKKYKKKKIQFLLNMWRHFSLQDSNLNYLYSVTPGEPSKSEYVRLEI